MKKFAQWLTAKNEADMAGVQPMSNPQPGNMQQIAQQASAKLQEALPLIAQLKTVASGWERQVGEIEQMVQNLSANLHYLANK